MMIKSLPQITSGAFIRCLTAIGLYNGEIPAEVFKKLDTKGNDIRRLFSQIGIIERTTQKARVIVFSKVGKQLYECREDKKRFGELLHSILISKVPQYRILTDYLSSRISSIYKKKKEIFIELKEKQSSSGWNLPEPTFKSLLVLAEMTNLISYNENNEILVNQKNDTKTFYSIFMICIKTYKEKYQIEHMPTQDILECFVSKMKEREKDITLEVAFELLKTFAEDLNIKFVFGVGQKDVPGTHAIIEIK